MACQRVNVVYRAFNQYVAQLQALPLHSVQAASDILFELTFFERNCAHFLAMSALPGVLEFVSPMLEICALALEF